MKLKMGQLLQSLNDAFCLPCVCFEICQWISVFPIAGNAVHKPEVCK